MDVLVLSNSGMGLFKFRKELFEELIKQGHRVILSLPNDKYVTQLQKIGCEYIESKVDKRGKNPLRDLKLLQYYKRIINRIKPDIVLTYTIKPNIYGGLACKSLNIPYIANITGLGTAVENKGMLQKVTLFLYKKAFKKINAVFFQNEENMLFFQKFNISNGKHKLLPGSGVNLDYFKLLDYPSGDKVRFVFISRIMKEKGIDYYLESSKELTQKYNNLEFHICGYCEEIYEEKLNEYVKKGYIIYHGLIDDMRTILKDIHCTVHPTYYPEGMSNVLLESASCGRPVITTNRSGTRETLDDGITGFMIEPKNQEQLTGAIEKFIKLSNSEMKQMGILGRNKMERQFDRNIVINQYLDEINKV